METKELISKVRDLFGEVYIGGSYAVDTILGNTINPESDIDFYTVHRPITRYMVKDIIKNVLFKGHYVNFTCNPEGNHEYYKMPNMLRRISVEVQDASSSRFGSLGQPKRYDFIFIQGLTVDYLLRNQASTATMCCLQLNFSPKGYIPHVHSKFEKCHDEKVIDINVHEDWCTEQHKQKIYEKYGNYHINKYSKPRNEALDNIINRANNLNW